MDRYNERLIVVRPNPIVWLALLGCVILTLIGAVLVILSPPLGVLIFAGGIALIVITKDGLHQEIEFIITNGDIEIARIINKKKKALLWVASGKKNANIPSGVKTVIRRAFTNSTATSVNIPKTVKTIEKDGLTSIYINKVFVSKNSRYFARKGQCVYDKKHHALSVAVTRNDGILCIADKVRRLQSDNSIAGHDVDTLIVPSSVRSSTGTGFNLERLGLLDEVYFLGKKPPKIVKAAPSGYHSLPVFCKVYVPKGCKKTYINWYMKNKCYDDIKSLTEMSDKKRTELIRIAASNTVKEPSKKKTKIAGSNTGTSSTDSQR